MSRPDIYERERIEEAVVCGVPRCCAENWCVEDEMCYCDPADHAGE